ncbi:MAG: cytochrome c family protein, partial [Thiovulaceae bacterium]|nr:cytochrome c family protein [Sulfurimonadaceae bacterium]
MHLFAEENQRIVDELASPKHEIPLRNSMGQQAYDDAIGSGKYRYVGNSKCRLCHRKFFIGRKNDPHDHSMESLVKTGYENNSRCLTCHSTGHGTESGYVNERLTPRLSNVQCEGCHGPGNVHIDMAKEK